MFILKDYAESILTDEGRSTLYSEGHAARLGVGLLYKMNIRGKVLPPIGKLTSNSCCGAISDNNSTFIMFN